MFVLCIQHGQDRFYRLRLRYIAKYASILCYHLPPKGYAILPHSMVINVTWQPSFPLLVFHLLFHHPQLPLSFTPSLKPIFSQIIPAIDSFLFPQNWLQGFLSASGTSEIFRFVSEFLVIIFSVVVQCCRLSWLLSAFETTINILYLISYDRRDHARFRATLKLTMLSDWNVDTRNALSWPPADIFILGTLCLDVALNITCVH